MGGHPADVAEQSPVKPIHLTPFGFHIVSRHADVAAILRDKRFGKNFIGRITRRSAPTILEKPVYRCMSHWMLQLDPPDHGRLRGLVAQAFTARRVQDMRPRIQQIVDEIIDHLKPMGRMDVIADFGSGYYVERLSPIVGAHGRIIAEDIVPEYLQNLRKRVRALGLQNVTITAGEPHDPRLPTKSADMAILVHMYHEIAEPYALLYNLVPSLKSGARVGIVDAFKPISEHGTPPRVLGSCRATLLMIYLDGSVSTAIP